MWINKTLEVYSLPQFILPPIRWGNSCSQHGKGHVHLLNEKSVSVVGSRNASREAMEKTEILVKALVKRNIVVNAGLAKGIDTITHQTALKNNGRTIAVIGTPINQYYPKENKKL